MTDSAEPQRTPGSSRGKIWIAIGAGFLALVLIAGAAVLISRRQSGEKPQPAATDQRPESTVPRLEWNRVPDKNKMFSSEPHQSIFAVASTRVGYLAVGVDNASSDIDAAVWISEDGFTWDWVTDDSKALATPATEAMVTVSGYKEGAIAAGYAGSDENLDAAVWQTGDGRSWERIEDATGELGGPGDQAIADVSEFRGGLVAVGRLGAAERGQPAAWYSPDGRSWRRAGVGSGRNASANSQEMVSVAATEDGLVAVGFTIVEEDYEAAIWRSSDGESWQPVSIKDGSSQKLLSVTASDHGFVAAGGEFDDADRAIGVIWRSSDGRGWERVVGDGAESLGARAGQFIYGVHSHHDLIVAVGEAGENRPLDSGDEASWIDSAVWVSRDGLNWAILGDDSDVFRQNGEQTLFGVLVDSEIVIAGGYEGARGKSDAVIWYATSDSGP